MTTLKKAVVVLPVFLLMCMIILPPMVRAGTTGKIAGIVEDSKSGEAIPGATVRVEGTDFVTQTDADGEYYFLNLPAGVYNLSVTMMGFGELEKQDVRVLLDLTTPVDFEIQQVDMPLKRQIKVYAERDPIQRDLTASRSIVTSDRMAEIPNSVTVQAILANMSGTVVDRDNGFHVRGGRDGQVSYTYEGFSVQDPFYDIAGIRIMPDALEELNLTSGGFTAEYGEAMSGVVNAVTKEGSRNYHGKIKMYDGYTRPWDVSTGSFEGLTRTNNNTVSYNLSGPIPMLSSKTATFFVASEWLRNDGYLPHNKGESWTHTAKLNWQPTPNMKLTGIGSLYRNEYQNYFHRDVNGISYDFNLDGLSKTKKNADLWGLKGNYNLSSNSILSFSFNHFYTESKTAPESLFDTYWDQWPGYSVNDSGVYNGTIDDNNYLASSDYYWIGYTTGNDFDPTYVHRIAKYNAFSSTVTSQINREHQFRLGGELRDYRINWDAKQFYNDQPYGEKYAQSPVVAMAYFQDKMETRDFVINVGMRWDYFNSEVDYWNNVIQKNYRIKSKSKSYVSPRLGVSHPVSENSVIRFNYGYYYQAPTYQYMYTNIQADQNQGIPIFGYPDLQDERTISYELGLNQMINEDYRLDVTAYYKDIDNLISARPVYRDDGSLVPSNSGYPIAMYSNDDYGSVQGLDITFEKIGRGNFSGSFIYSYMVARGNASNSTEAYYSFIVDTSTVLPVQEYPLDFDQRHTATLNLSYRVPRDWKGRAFGMNIPGAWGLNFLGRYGSGMPYNVLDESGRQVGVNEGRLPSNYTVDMRFYKNLFMPRTDSYFSFFVEVDNLFDRRNVIDVYGNTGRPDVDRNINDVIGTTAEETQAKRELYTLFAKDPTHYSKPRTIRLGLEYNF